LEAWRIESCLAALSCFKKCQEPASNNNQEAASSEGVWTESRQQRGKAVAKGVALLVVLPVLRLTMAAS